MKKCIGSRCEGRAPLAALAPLALALAVASAGCAGNEFVGGDSAGSSSAGAAGFCATTGATHLFCEDFDEGVPGAKFTAVIPNGSAIAANGARIVADTTTFVSPPQSALAETPALLKAGDEGEAYLFATITAPTAGSQLRLDANFQVGSGCVANADGTTIAVVQVGGYAIGVVVLSAGAAIAEIQTNANGGTANERSYTFSPPPTDQWFDLGIDLDLSRRKLTVTESGATVLDGQSLQFAPQVPTASVALYLGAHVKNAVALSNGCQLHVDNVLFDISQ